MVAFLLDLMGPHQHLQFHLREQVFQWPVTETHGTATLVITTEVLVSLLTVLHWVCPEEVTHETIAGHFSEPIEAVDAFCVLHVRRNTTVHAQVLAAKLGHQGQCIKYLYAHLEELLVILGKALLPER